MQRLERAQLAARYPQIGLDGIEFGVLQPSMGALMARRSVQTLVAQFVSNGGAYRTLAIERPRAGAALAGLTSTGGETLRADQFVFACGPWLPKLFPEAIGTRIVPTRQDVYFFAPEAGDVRFDAGHLPAWVDADDADWHYGFPVIEARGFKIALDRHGPRFDPDTGERQIPAAGLTAVRAYLARRFPALAQRPLAESRVCQYENSASGDFIIDRHPTWPNAWLVGAGTGHGFKHGPAVGRYVADLVSGRSQQPEPRFALSRHAVQG
jgi:glycine/D-amino acid oxidase-like deaminating enzyme